MKFKEKRGNTFVFDFGEDEHYLTFEDNVYYLNSGRVAVFKSYGNIHIKTSPSCNYKEADLAVNLMQILIKEGLV